VVADICDDVAVMYAGEVVESGTAAAVLDRAAHPYTSALLAANPHVPEGAAMPVRLASIAGTVPAPGSWPTGCRFAGRCRFVQDRCTAPFAALPAHGDGSVRCIRVEEIGRAGVSWAPDEVGAELAPGAGGVVPDLERPTESVPAAGAAR